MKALIRIGLGIMLLFCWFTAAAAAVNTTDIQRAWAEACRVGTKGPAEVSLASQGTLNLPKHCVYLTGVQAKEFCTAIGGTMSPQFSGVIIPDSSDEKWIIVVFYVNSGHVSAQELQDQDALEQGFMERVKKTLPFAKWIDKPQYNAERHQIICSVAAGRDGGGASNTVLYEGAVLGRDGMLTLTLMTDKAHMEAKRSFMQTLLNRTQFLPGKGYAEKSSAYEAGEKVGRMIAPVVIVVAILALFAIGIGLFVYFRNRNNRDKNGPVA